MDVFSNKWLPYELMMLTAPEGSSPPIGQRFPDGGEDIVRSMVLHHCSRGTRTAKSEFCCDFKVFYVVSFF